MWRFEHEARPYLQLVHLSQVKVFRQQRAPRYNPTARPLARAGPPPRAPHSLNCGVVGSCQVAPATATEHEIHAKLFGRIEQ